MWHVTYHQTRFWALYAPKCVCGGALPGPSAPPARPLDVFECAASRQGRGREGRERKGNEGRGEKGEGRERGAKGKEGRGGKGEGREMDPRNFENRSTPIIFLLTLVLTPVMQLSMAQMPAWPRTKEKRYSEGHSDRKKERLVNHIWYNNYIWNISLPSTKDFVCNDVLQCRMSESCQNDAQRWNFNLCNITV